MRVPRQKSAEAKNKPIMHELGEREHDALLPPAKRKKIGGGVTKIADEEADPSPREWKTKRTMPEFRAETLDDFYKPCPNYRLPVELGAFSFDEKGTFRHDRSEQRYYHPPSHSSRVSLDLKVGYKGYIPKEKSGAPDLGPILRWISLNGHCFRPRNEPLSPNNGTAASSTAETTSSVERPLSQQQQQQGATPSERLAYVLSKHNSLAKFITTGTLFAYFD